MSDPVAEAAANLAAQEAEPTLLEKAMDTIHDLEAKVEHLIHPEAVSVTIESKPSLDSAPIATAPIAEAGSATAGESVANAVIEASTPTLSDSPDSTSAAARPESASSPHGAADLPNAVSAVVESTTVMASAVSASGSGETSSIGGSSDEPVNMRLSADPLHVRIAAHLEAIAGHLNAIYSTAKDAPTAAATGTSALKTHVGDILHRISNGMQVTEGELVQKLEALYRML